MQAQKFQIISRGEKLPGMQPDPSDFTLEGGEIFDAQKILNESTVSLYCLDPKSDEAIFVIIPSDIHLNEVPFYIAAQYEHAVQVIKVSYNTLYHLADQVELDDQRLILIYSTGRSGTTVTSLAFNQVEDVTSFSEPDVFTQLVQLRDYSRSSDALISKLTAACTRLTCKQSALNEKPIWALKFKSFVIDLADLIYQNFPEAKCLFLYRNAEPWFDSYMRTFGGYLSPEAMEESWLWCKSTIRMVDSYPIYNHGEITAGLMMGLMWLNNMERCYEMIKAGHPILPVRYEDLKANPLSVMEKLFDYCGVNTGNKAALANVFATDSQAGTGIARDKISQMKWDFDAELLDDLHQVIAEHPVINTVDYVLPGTLTL
jgi:hypothetical protein